MDYLSRLVYLCFGARNQYGDSVFSNTLQVGHNNRIFDYEIVEVQDPMVVWHLYTRVQFVSSNNNRPYMS